MTARTSRNDVRVVKGGEHDEEQGPSRFRDARNGFLRNLRRSDVVLDAASRYTGVNAASEVSWAVVFCFTS